MTRLFIALELPENIKERLVACRGGIEGARWQSAGQMHLTLRFIGEATPQQEKDIRAAMAGYGRSESINTSCIERPVSV